MASKQQQQYELTYFTIPAEEHDEIRAYLEKRHVHKALVFYGSFINYCIKYASAVKNPQSGNKAPEDHARMLFFVNTLRQRPLTAKAFIDLMEIYRKHSYKNGSITSGQAEPRDKNKLNIMNAQEELKRQLFSKSDRNELLIAAGKPPKVYGNERQRERAKKRKEMSVAKRRNPLDGGMQAMDEQIREVEQEIEAEDAAGWKMDLAIRGEKQQ